MTWPDNVGGGHTKTGRLRAFSISIVLLQFIIQTSEAQRLSISPHGTQVKTVNSGVMFMCTLSEYRRPGGVTSLPAINWLGPTMTAITATRGRVYVERTDEYNLRLYITKMNDTDAGPYTCTAEVPSTQPDGQLTTLTLSDDTRLFLFEDIQFMDTPTHESHQAGSSPLLQCVASGQPTPEVSWRFNRRRIVPDNTKYELEADGLRVKRLDIWDNGTYECRAEVASHGNVKLRFIDLEVLYPPSIVRPPVADDVVKGHDTTLRCVANGNPPVEYEWFKEQKMSEMIRVKVRLAQGTNTYVIRRVSADDEGRYFCRATNMFGSRESYVDIRMLVPPSVLPLPGRIVRAEGTTLTLPCEATGTPIPTVGWGRAGGSENHTEDEQFNKLAQEGILSVQSGFGVSTLIIRDIRRAYAGNLACTARNAAGVDSSNVSFVVEFSPSVAVLEKEQYGWPGQTRNVTCVSNARPSPSMNWYRGEQYLTDSDIYRVTNYRSDDNVTSVLSVSIGDSQPWLFGSYSCIAKNVHGYVTDTGVIIEALPPDAPRNVSVLSETRTSVTLSAAAPVKSGGLPVSTWQIQYDEEAADGPRRITRMFVQGERLTVTELLPGTSYTFSLSAGNAVGYGPAIKFRVTTLPLEAPTKQLPAEDVDDVVELEESLHDDNNVKSSSSSSNRHVEYNIGPNRPSAQSDSSDALSINQRQTPDDNNLDDLSRPLIGDQATVVVAVTVGSTIVIVVIVVAAACGVAARRRHRSPDNGGGPRSELGPPAEAFALTPRGTTRRSMRRPADDPLPDVDDDSTNGSRSTRPEVGTVQRREWQRMITETATAPGLSDEDVEEDEDGGFVDDIAVGYLGHGRSPRLPRVRVTLQRPPPGAVDVGYRSADNVDDDIEMVDYSLSKMGPVYNPHDIRIQYGRR